MPRFLAVYTMKPEHLAPFRSQPKDTVGTAQRARGEERHAVPILDRGGMVRKTTRITRDGGRGGNR